MDVDPSIAYIVATLLLLTAIAAGIVLWSALRLTRRNGDAARSWLAVYKISFALFVLALALYFVDSLLAIFMHYDNENENIPLPVDYSGKFAHYRVLSFAAFFEEIAVYLASVAILGLAAGIRVVHANRELPADRTLRQASYGIAVPFGTIKAVVLVMSNIMTYRTSIISVLILITTTIKFLFAILLVVWSVIVAKRTKSESRVKTATKYFRGCCVLLLIRASYAMIANIIWVTMQSKTMELRYFNYPMDWTAILIVVLQFWPVFALFVLLFSLGAKMQHGLWANHQSFAMTNLDGQAQQARNSESRLSQDLSVPPLEPNSSRLVHELYGSQLALDPQRQERRSLQQLYELDAYSSPPPYSEAVSPGRPGAASEEPGAE